jgi:hypothetical protein
MTAQPSKNHDAYTTRWDTIGKPPFDSSCIERPSMSLRGAA